MLRLPGWISWCAHPCHGFLCTWHPVCFHLMVKDCHPRLPVCCFSTPKMAFQREICRCHPPLAGVTSSCSGTAPEKGLSFSLTPFPGAPTMASYKRGQGASGHGPLSGPLHDLPRSLHPRVTSLPLTTVPTTSPQQSWGDPCPGSPLRPPPPLSAAALSPQPPLTAGPDPPPGRAPGFARHPGPANQRAACGRPRGLEPIRERLLAAAPKRPRGPPALGRPACQ